MKQIDEFVNSIYANISGKEAKEMKEEMRTHLVEAVEELKTEGKSEQEAISIAINRFGDEKQITKGLISIFKAQNKIVKNLFRVTLISLIISLGSFIGLFVRDQVAINVQLNVQDTLNSVISNSGDKKFTEAEKNQIISDLKEVTNDKLEYFFLYKKPGDIPESIDRTEFPQVYSEMDEVIKYGISHKNMYFSNQNKKWYAEVGYNGSQPSGTLYTIPYSFFIISAILGFVVFILKQNSQRKMLNIFLKD
ncbi:permease prefix domain 1-containing protein [Viridibacillus sp. NPDC093762]|uniref:permease prefix domain 1-containing protein n=1 Tax=Viridibacillus sp. NPDC093762 TaxID=3390720 RepID=UPI003CFEDE23